jgi:ABC-type molybdate transport system substrate-binding protein
MFMKKITSSTAALLIVLSMATYSLALNQSEEGAVREDLRQERWEYVVVSVTTGEAPYGFIYVQNEGALATEANRLGQEGWELVTGASTGRWYDLWFKRRLQ